MKLNKKSLLPIALTALIATIYACKNTDSTVTPSSATITALSCGSTTFSANPINGTAFTGTASVPYTGGNGVAYSAGVSSCLNGCRRINGYFGGRHIGFGGWKRHFCRERLLRQVRQLLPLVWVDRVVV